MIQRDSETQYVFLAVGGTGAKVAEAFINMMSIGVPLGAHNSEGYSSFHENDRLRIIRIDPDKGCRADSLTQAVDRYRLIQNRGGLADKRGLWGLIADELEVIAPLEALEGPKTGMPTLGNQLASSDDDGSTVRLLNLFYKNADLETGLDRGFFQKAHIGASIIGSMGAVKVNDVPSRLLDRLGSLVQSKVRILIVGSVFGGTGAAGLPVLGRIVRSFIAEKGLGERWKVGGCLLGPYFYPPSPPTDAIDWGDWTPNGEEGFHEYLDRTQQSEESYLSGVVDRMVGEGHHAEPRDYNYDEVRQIALGYYAKPEEIELRAAAAWRYYQRHRAAFFDRRYLLGLGSPTRYDDMKLKAADYDQGEPFREEIAWSNGGKDQVAPLHAVEVAAACCAMHFFSEEEDPEGVLSMGAAAPAGQVGLDDLAASRQVEVSRWIAASLVGANWLRHGLLPAIASEEAYAAAKNELRGLHGYLEEAQFPRFHEDLQAISEAMRVSLLHIRRALGWEVDSQRVMQDWDQEKKRLSKEGRVFKKRAREWDIGRWRLGGVDAETIGAALPRKGHLQSGSTEGLAVLYLRELWQFCHEGFRSPGQTGTGSPELLLPRFGLEWANRPPAVPRQFAEIKWSEAGVPDRQGPVAVETEEFALRVESKPTAWAHAETFYEGWLAEQRRADFSPQGEAFQLWGGLLAALFRGSVRIVTYSRDDLRGFDQDLPPAIEKSLPFDLSEVADPSIRAMHEEGALTVLRAGESPRSAVMGVCYAPCLVAPAAEGPREVGSRELQALVDAVAGTVTLDFDRLVAKYCRAPGFVESFVASLDALRARVGNDPNHPDVARALTRLARHAASFRPADNVVEPAAVDHHRDPADTWFGYQYRPPVHEGPEQWRNYPLRTVGEDGRTILFIAEGVERELNQWSEEPAFPGTGDTETLLCDLRIVGSQDDRVQLEGREGRTYTTTPEQRVVRLGPGPDDGFSIFMPDLYVLAGSDSVVSEHIDPLHKDWGARLDPRQDATALLPLHRKFFEFFPAKLTGSLAGELRYEQGSLDGGHAMLSWQVPAQGSPARYSFSVKVLELGGRKNSPPSVDLWPGIRWSASGVYFLRCYRDGGSQMDLAVHGEKRLGSGQGVFTRAAEPEQTTVITHLHGPPAVAELLLNRVPQAMLKLDVQLPAPQPNAIEEWDIGVDFGTSNTSVAFKAANQTACKAVEFRSLSAPLWRTRRDQEEGYADVLLPGWFLDGDDVHRGFFPTLLAYKLSNFAAAGGTSGAPLLTALSSPQSLSPGLLCNLVGSVDVLGLYGPEALEIETREAAWGVADDLKWAEEAAVGGTSERLRIPLRTAFLARLLMQICAQALRATGLLPARYVFTYPLAMEHGDVDSYRRLAQHAVAAVEGLFMDRIVEVDDISSKVRVINESEASFRAYLHAMGERGGFPETSRVVIIDMGGGSADYSVFSKDRLCFLDSLRLAGNRFFDFIRDSCDSDEQFGELAQRLEFMLDSSLWTGEKGLRSDRTLTAPFRRYYNLTVASMMPGKSNRESKAADAIPLDEREASIATTVFSAHGDNPTYHWKRALFKTLLGHGLLLGFAPVAGQPPVTTLHLVLAGNGWRLLCYGGLRRAAHRSEDDSVHALVKDEILRALERFGGYCERPEIAGSDGRHDVKISFMDDLVYEAATGKGVYSKDMVAVGGLLAPVQDRQEPVVRAAPLGVELHVTQGDQKFAIPWYKAQSATAFKELVSKIGLKTDSGLPFFEAKAETLLELVDMEFPIPTASGLSAYVPEQVLALGLYQRAGRQQIGLTQEDLKLWSNRVQRRARAALRGLQASAAGTDIDRTSVIRAVWEYCLEHERRRKAIFQGERG